MVNCSVSKCKNRSNKRNLKNDGISYHLFPRVPRMRQKWQEFCNREPNWQPYRTSTICSEHFEPSQFQRGTNRRFLVAKAMPTIYPAHINEDEESDDSLSSDPLDQNPQSPAGSEHENGKKSDGSLAKESDTKEKTSNTHKLRIQLREKRLKIHRLIESNRYLTEKVEILQNILKRVINKSKYVKHKHKNGFK